MFSSLSISSGMNTMLRSEHKSVVPKIDLMSSFVNVEVQMLDTCNGTLATAKALLQLLDHGRSGHSEKNSECF